MGYFRAELTRYPPDVYRALMYEWPLHQLYIFLEANRVRLYFDEVDRAMEAEIGRNMKQRGWG